MSAFTSPAALQQICEAAAATWLTDWSGLVSARSLGCQPRCLHAKHETEPSVSTGFKRDVASVNTSECNCLVISNVEGTTDLKGAKSRGNIAQKCRRCRVKKKTRKVDRTVAVQYDSELSSANGLSEYLGHDNYLELEDNLKNNHSERQNIGNEMVRIGLVNFDKDIFNENVDNCSSFFKHFLPPGLANQIMNLAWNRLSQLVLGSCNECVQDYKVEDWIRRAPVLLQLGSNFSSKSFPLSISGIPDNLIENVLEVINQHFPLKALSSFEVPKTNFKRSQMDFSSSSRDIYKNILLQSALTSVTLNSDICNDSILRALSQLSLKELEIGGSGVTEKGIVNGLCALPIETTSEMANLIRNGFLQFCPSCALRKSLQKLDISVQSLNSSVYHAILAVFPNLLYYNAHRNMVQCVQNFARLNIVRDSNIPPLISQKTLSLLRMNAGHASRDSLIEIARICPQLQDIALIVDLDAEVILPTLKNFPHLTHITIMYYPSSHSSPPKFNARIFQVVIDMFKSQLRSLSLTGFSISGDILHELSQLPELYHLSLSDCWLSNPRSLPLNPFLSLEKLSLNFAPPNMIMQLFTLSGGVQSLHLDLKESEWEGNAFTDASIKYLVTSGIIKSLQTFTATSSYLTMESLKTLASLPYLRTVGHLASWGLTEEELQCIDHSGPAHLLCLL